VPGKHGLVGGDHALAGFEGRDDAGIGCAVLTSDQLDENVDRIRAREPRGVVMPFDRVEVEATLAHPFACTDRNDAHGAAELGLECLAMALQQTNDGRADRAQSRNAEPERFLHDVSATGISGWR
jgi:hypothetical protein